MRFPREEPATLTNNTSTVMQLPCILLSFALVACEQSVPSSQLAINYCELEEDIAWCVAGGSSEELCTQQANYESFIRMAAGIPSACKVPLEERGKATP